ncbi:FAD-binding Berberine family protein [Striga hermonthica]|uniref:FAD-binding Berberine family protein n=1 Tax=Striga hermonthica TaxID=68872 RepID=A0A9N7RDJ4_STRHE|nr:FAD-binding Berberine family protein [Striga hermonthica]
MTQAWEPFGSSTEFLEESATDRLGPRGAQLSSSPPPFDPKPFHQCINSHLSSNDTPTGFTLPSDPSFSSILNSTAMDTKCLAPNIPKPALIITPYSEAEAQWVVACAFQNHVRIRVRNGGHDYECLSYASFMGLPFVVLDLQNLRNITVDVVSKTAVVQAGATVGELYYAAANASGGTLGFPAGLCTTVGVAGNFLGGGYGMMMRTYGLAADNVVDALLVTADGRLLDRASMGEDLFWAIRGGAGGSFGVVLEWKVRLVKVPKKVTVFNVVKTLDQPNGIDVLYKWQNVGPVVNKKLFMRVLIEPYNSTVMTIYSSMFLGSKAEAVRLMKNKFPQLGLTDKDFLETSWIESVMLIGGYNSSMTPDYLLKRISVWKPSFKAKSDMVQTAIPRAGLRKLCEAVKQQSNGSLVVMTPYGGKIWEIAEDATPFPHRNNTLFMVQYVGQWATEDKSPETQAQNEKWVRGVYEMMTPYVSSNPRRAYVNYRDLDLGKDEKNCPNCSCPSIWGHKYFKNNFMRLVAAKTKADPFDFFLHEQSIPTYSTLNTCIPLVS